MFYGECYKCGERWELGTASTCKCEVGMTFDASRPVTITSHPYFYKRLWVGLTDEELHEIREWQQIQKELGPVWAPMMMYLYLAIEAKLKEKNT